MGPDFKVRHWWQVYIDNYDEGQVLDSGRLEEELPHCEEWSDELLRAAHIWNIPYSREKRARGATQGGSLGGAADGKEGLVTHTLQQQIKIHSTVVHKLNASSVAQVMR